MNACATRSRAMRSIRPRSVVATCAMLALQIAIFSGTGRAVEPAFMPAPHVHAELLCDAASIQPGMTFRLGVRLVMENGWHVNWTNPGDAGLAPSIAWKLPAGFRAGLVRWPLPERFVTGPLVIFGYAGDVLLETDVRAPAGLAPGQTVDLAAEVSWLACADACVPDSARVRMQLPVEAVARADAEAVARFETTRARCPSPSGSWNVQARVEDSSWIVLDIQTADPTTPPLAGLFFFPYDPGVIENAAPQTTSALAGPLGRTAYQLRIERARMPVGSLSRLSGVLVSTSGWSGGNGPAAIDVDAPMVGR